MPAKANVKGSDPRSVVEVDQKGSNLYVVRKAAPKCLFEELDRFNEVALEPILRFFRFYGKHGKEIGEIIQAHR